MTCAVRLAVEGRFCGPASVGSVEIIRLVRTHAHLSLSEAKYHVDRCIFSGETIDLSMPSREAAVLLIQSLERLTLAPVIHASLLEQDA